MLVGLGDLVEAAGLGLEVRLHEARGLCDADDVEDQGDAAVAEDGRASVGARRLEHLCDGFDDDLLRIDHVVHHEAVLPALRLYDADVEHLLGLKRRAVVAAEAERLGEEDQGEQLPAEAVDRDVVHELEDLGVALPFEPDELK